MEPIDSSRRKLSSPATPNSINNNNKNIPSTVCSYYVNAQKGVGQGCLRLNCKFYHGTQEQLDEIHRNAGIAPTDHSADGAAQKSATGDDADKKKDRSKKPIVCLSFLADNCHRPDCRFVHLPPHIRPLPTSACTYNERGMCTRARCRFFHGPEEALEKMTKEGVTMYNPLTNEPHDKRIDIAALDIARRGNESLGTTQHMYQVEGGGSTFQPIHHHQQPLYAMPPQMYPVQQQHGGFFAHAFHQPQQGSHVKIPPPPPPGLVNVQGQHPYHLQGQQFMNQQLSTGHLQMAQPTFVFTNPPQSPTPQLGREGTSSSIQSSHRGDSNGHLLVSGHMISTMGQMGSRQNSEQAGSGQHGSGHQLRSVSTADADHGGSTNDPFAFRSGGGSGALYSMPQSTMSAQTQFMQASAHGSSNSEYHVQQQGSGSHNNNDGSNYLLQTRDGFFVSGMANVPVSYGGAHYER